ncbi:MAG: permease-like cell division protein FtsX [Clostridia bacterium]|nr:permease-like cell division protein FtsX [Clostridia bacterium]
MINTIGYWFIESIEGIKKNRKTFFIGLGTMIAVLCIIGALYILQINANSFMGSVNEDESKVNLYVQGLTSGEVTIIFGQLTSIEGVSKVEYIDERQAYEKARQMDPKIVEGITPEEGVFKPSFILTVEGDSNGNIASIQQEVFNIERLKQAITKSDGFNEAEKSIKIAKTIEVVSITVLFLVTVLGCFLMMNSIKLALYARRKEISIMKYVGATDTFTRAPFIMEGLIIALIAAAITLLITSLVYGGILNTTNEVQLFNFMVSKEEILSKLSILLVVVSVGIGTIGSAMSISKYLDV